MRGLPGTAQVEVVPGRHIVAVADGVVAVVAHRAETPVTAISRAWRHTNAVLELVTAAAAEDPENPGRAFARLATTWLMGLADEESVEFGVLTPVGAGVAVFLHGGVRAVLDAERHTEILRGRDAGFTVDRLITPVPAVGIGLYVDGPEREVENLPVRGVFGLSGGTVPGAAAVLWTDGDGHGPALLRPSETRHRTGVVLDKRRALDVAAPPRDTGAGALLSAEAAAPARGTGTDREPANAPDGRPEPPRDPRRTTAPRPVIAADLEDTVVPSAADAVRNPAPPAPTADRIGGVVVQGFPCPRRHLNDPRVSYCAVCGLSMHHPGRTLTDGLRPPLGILLLDDGQTLVLDGDLVLGREPEHHEAVARGARPIRIADPSGGMSRAHAEIRLVDWDVTVVDGGSTNGTHLRAAGRHEWTRAVPGHPMTLAPGTQLLLGGRVCTFDSPHQS
ncbi:FHA domain-containing protein [Nocardia harenae]|uniref:FHA domain-containing protein n=1 Tax=Nocardia harenae TaxID=358707 RepID=UPI0008373E17|nr:FHA domain-containing protein [Nocardia harenae]